MRNPGLSTPLSALDDFGVELNKQIYDIARLIHKLPNKQQYIYPFKFKSFLNTYCSHRIFLVVRRSRVIIVVLIFLRSIFFFDHPLWDSMTMPMGSNAVCPLKNSVHNSFYEVNNKEACTCDKLCKRIAMMVFMIFFVCIM